METGEETERWRARIVGRVQGVGFRWWTFDQARALGLRGTVRNCSDGSVEVDAEGSMGAIEELRRLLAIGPPAARVDRIDPLPDSDRPLPETFDITR